MLACCDSARMHVPCGFSVLPLTTCGYCVAGSRESERSSSRSRTPPCCSSRPASRRAYGSAAAACLSPSRPGTLLTRPSPRRTRLPLPRVRRLPRRRGLILARPSPPGRLPLRHTPPARPPLRCTRLPPGEWLVALCDLRQRQCLYANTQAPIFTGGLAL